MDLLLGQAVLATGHVTRNCGPEGTVHGWGTETNSSWLMTSATLPSGATADGGTMKDRAQTDPLVAYAAYSSWPASVDITWKDNGSTRSATTESIGQPSGGRLELEYSDGRAPNGSWQLTVTPAGGGATLL